MVDSRRLQGARRTHTGEDPQDVGRGSKPVCVQPQVVLPRGLLGALSQGGSRQIILVVSKTRPNTAFWRRGGGDRVERGVVCDGTRPSGVCRHTLLRTKPEATNPTTSALKQTTTEVWGRK